MVDRVDQYMKWTGPYCIYILSATICIAHRHTLMIKFYLKTILINFQRSCNNFYPRFRIWTFYMFLWSFRSIIILNNDMLTTIFIVNFLFSFSMYIAHSIFVQKTKSLNSTTWNVLKMDNYSIMGYVII